MKTRILAGVLLILTLLIGVLIGALGHRAIVHDMMRSGPMMRTFRSMPGRLPPGGGLSDDPGFGPEMIARRLEHLIDLEGAQRDSVLAILSAHFEQFSTVNLRHRQEAMTLMDSLRLELEPLLSEEQMRRLDEHLKRRHLLSGRRRRPPDSVSP